MFGVLLVKVCKIKINIEGKLVIFFIFIDGVNVNCVYEFDI